MVGGVWRMGLGLLIVVFMSVLFLMFLDWLEKRSWDRWRAKVFAHSVMHVYFKGSDARMRFDGIWY